MPRRVAVLMAFPFLAAGFARLACAQEATGFCACEEIREKARHGTDLTPNERACLRSNQCAAIVRDRLPPYYRPDEPARGGRLPDLRPPTDAAPPFPQPRDR